MSKESAKEQILALGQKYAAICSSKDDLNRYNEEMTKLRFINPLFQALGWDIENKNRKDEVTFEDRISKGRVDYGFKINGIPKFYLEAKSLKVDIDDPAYAKQAIDYAWNKGCPWAILTNFRKVKVFNADIRDTNLSRSQFFEITYDRYAENFDQLSLLSRSAFEYSLLDRQAETWGKKAKKVRVNEQLLSDFTRFREILLANIARNNQNKKLTELELDEAVQRILDRLIFIRYAEDKELEPKQLLPNLRQWESEGRGHLIKNLRAAFAYFDRHYNSKIFAKHLCDELEIDNEILHEIIEGLHFDKEKLVTFDFSVIEADVLGNIYEQYLGHILKKTAKTARLTDGQTHRKEQGIYYTPTYIVDYIVRETLGKLLAQRKTVADKIKVLDLACGSGSFLIKAFDILNEYHRKCDRDYEQTTLDTTAENGTYTKKLRILQNNIFGVDLDRQAVEVAQLNLLLKVAERGRRLPLLQQNIKQGNSLIEASLMDEDKAFNWKKEFPHIINDEGFDVIIGNPPYVKIQTLGSSQVQYFNANYKSATKNYDIYVLFVERALSLLKEGGIIGLILPSRFLNAEFGIGLRKILSEQRCISKLVNFGEYQVFDDAITYTCLLFLTKSTSTSFQYWLLEERDKLATTKALSKEFFSISDQTQPSNETAWNFIPDDSKKLMKRLGGIKLKLNNICDKIFVGLQTSADLAYIVEILREGDYYEIRNRKTSKTYRIEKNIIKRILMGKDIKRWSINWRKLGIILPYEIIDGKAVLIDEKSFKKEYPYAWRYFMDNKSLLDLRENGTLKNKRNWHAFVYEKNLDIFVRPKLITQVLSSRSSFTYDEKGEYYFVGAGSTGGYGIVLKQEYSQEYLNILALLNSKVLEFYLRNTSTPFKGGFYSYGKRFITGLPIIIPKGKEGERLNELSKEQLRRSAKLAEIGSKRTDERAQLEEETARADTEIDEIIYNLYNISDDEKRIIENCIVRSS